MRAEADFGHIYVDFPDGRRQVPVLIVTWSYSNAPFAIALPTERTEAILHGMVEAFAFFGCVPVELWWDNPKTVAIHIYQGRLRTLHRRYAALASHYPFTPKFCLPVTATEKPRVENRVFDLQRQWATPVPRVTTKQLREQYAEVFGEATAANNKSWLMKRIAWRLQANAEGGLSERAKARAAELANDAELRKTPPPEKLLPPMKAGGATRVLDVTIDERLPPPGSIITRRYKGGTVQVKVLDDGFEYSGEAYASLSAVAKAVTGSHCNGFLFFRLGEHGGDR